MYILLVVVIINLAKVSMSLIKLEGCCSLL